MLATGAEHEDLNSLLKTHATKQTKKAHKKTKNKKGEYAVHTCSPSTGEAEMVVSLGLSGKPAQAIW